MNTFEYRPHVKTTDVFLNEYGFDYVRHPTENDIKWRYLDEETGENLRNFLKLVFGLGDDEVRNTVRRSEADPYTFFVDHFRFTALLKVVGYLDENNNMG